MKRIVLWTIILILLSCGLYAIAEDIPVISFDSDTYSLGVGKTLSIKPIITPKSNMKLEWSSSDEEIAVVSPKGVVRGVSVGETVVTVKSIDNSEVSASIKISVVIPVKKITLSEKSFEMPVDMTWNLSAMVLPEDATNKAIIWSSSNEKIATINEEGTIKSKSIGTTKITATATDGSKVKATINVRVDQFDIVIDGMGSVKQTLSTNHFGGEYIKAKTKNKIVEVKLYGTSQMISSGVINYETTFNITPLKPGIDIITYSFGSSRLISRVFVSPRFLEEQEKIKQKIEEIENQKSIIDENETKNENGSGNIQFKGIPWGVSYNEMVKKLAEKGDDVKQAIVRNKAIWTQIDGDLIVGDYKAYKNGLSFYYDSIDKDNIEECKEKCQFYKVDCYFDLDIPFADLKSNIMKTFGLSEYEMTSSSTDCSWKVNNVDVELSLKQKFIQLSIECDLDKISLDTNEATVLSGSEEDLSNLSVSEGEVSSLTNGETDNEVRFLNLPWKASLSEVERIFEENHYALGSKNYYDNIVIAKVKEPLEFLGVPAKYINLYFVWKNNLLDTNSEPKDNTFLYLVKIEVDSSMSDKLYKKLVEVYNLSDNERINKSQYSDAWRVGRVVMGFYRSMTTLEIYGIDAHNMRLEMQGYQPE